MNPTQIPKKCLILSQIKCRLTKKNENSERRAKKAGEVRNKVNLTRQHVLES